MNAHEATPMPIAVAALATPTAPRSTLKWRFKDHWWGETARFNFAGIDVRVQDCDGDYSFWEIRRGKKGPLIAKGDSSAVHHWDICLREAQDALIDIVAKRIADLRAVKAGSVPTKESSHA